MRLFNFRTSKQAIHFRVLLLIVILLFTTTMPTIAANGDIAGNLYYTDIVAYMNEAPITSYNIGGKTVIDAEILNWYYGFDMYWHADTRKLEFTDWGGGTSPSQVELSKIYQPNKGKQGEFAGYYYETDIVTTIDGKEIESYNIGGRTFLVAEKMKDLGYNVVWDADHRTLSISKPMDFYKFESDFGTFTDMADGKDYDYTAWVYQNGIYFDGKELNLSPQKSLITISPYYAYYFPLKPVLDAVGAEYSIEKKPLYSGEYATDFYFFNMNFDGKKELPLIENSQDNVSITKVINEFPATFHFDFRFVANGQTYNNRSKTIYGTPSYAPCMIYNNEVYVTPFLIADLLGYQCDDGIHLYKKVQTNQ